MILPALVRVIDGAQRIHLPGDDDTCVLLIHGFTGSPYEMRYLANGINERTGWTVLVPRLPGHATCGEDFATTGMRDWLRAAVDEYIDLKASCTKVYVAGLSMGGILAGIIGALFGVERIAMYSPAYFTTKQVYKPIIYLSSLFVNRTKKRHEWKEEDRVKEILRREYWRYNWMKQYREFFRLQKLGLKMLRDLKGESLMVVVSKGDDTVPVRVVDVIKKRTRGNFKTVVLEKSSHVITEGVEKEVVLEKTVEWFRG